MYESEEWSRQLYDTYDLYGSGVQVYGTAIRPRFRRMRSTEVHITRINSTYPGLRLVDVVHPPGGRFSRPSYEERLGLIGMSGKKRFVKRKPI